MARVLSCFHDETGEQDMHAGYYMVAMVIHEQEDSLEPYIRQYEERLRTKEETPLWCTRHKRRGCNKSPA